MLNDIVGLTGKKIIADFVAGERSGTELAKHQHYNIKKSEEEIAKALQYNGRDDYFFAFKQEWKTYLHLQKQIDETDKEIKKLLKGIIKNDKTYALSRLARWHEQVRHSGFRTFNTISKTIELNYIDILNYFDNKSTNASAESFNAKIKGFRTQLKSIRKVDFFMFRIQKIWA